MISQRGDGTDLTVLGHVLEQTTHDLARACLGQLVDDHDLARLGDRSDLLGDVVAKLGHDVVALISVGTQDD